jgi:hypothetical protein
MKHSSFFESLERQELIDKLRENGYGEMIDALLENENRVYTKKGRLNKCGACRVLKWKPKQLDDAIKECQQIVRKEIGEEE